jgi:hypothetical protein
MCGVSLSVQWLTRAIVDGAQPRITQNRARLADEDRSIIVMRRRVALGVVVAVTPQGRSRVHRKSVEPSRASRTLAPGTRSEDRSDRPGPPRSGHRALPEMSSVAGHRSPRKPAATRDHETSRRAGAPPDRLPFASSSSRLPIPSVETARKEEGENLVRATRLGRGHRACQDGNAVKQRAGPAVKPVTQTSSPRGAERAVGGIRAWGEIRAAGPAHKPQYSHSGRLRARTSK